ncbi:hypothetical protein COO20_11380 [Thalassospira marina]|uniref:Uncharacterized protein n=1 Tax=Thalassospira marina TaxID=2048283 RepID=A0A2N3KUG3_9PROT|nr:hypothetical protein COO20_11380 [Thalassospira marina]
MVAVPLWAGDNPFGFLDAGGNEKFSTRFWQENHMTRPIAIVLWGDIHIYWHIARQQAVF